MTSLFFAGFNFTFVKTEDTLFIPGFIDFGPDSSTENKEFSFFANLVDSGIINQKIYSVASKGDDLDYIYFGGFEYETLLWIQNNDESYWELYATTY